MACLHCTCKCSNKTMSKIVGVRGRLFALERSVKCWCLGLFIGLVCIVIVNMYLPELGVDGPPGRMVV